MSLQRNEHEIYCFILSILGFLKEWVNIMILLTILAFFACACNQGTSTWWRWATDPYRLSPWVNGVNAAMAGTERKCFTMHDCHKNVNSFCYICTRYEVTSLRKKIDDEVSTLYKKCFGHKVLHQETNWVPHIICNSCRLMLYRSRNSGFQKYCRFSTPAIWKQPLRMKDCYFCIGFPTMLATTVKNKANGSIKI